MSQNNQLGSESFTDLIARIVKEGGIILWLGLAVFMQLSMFGYDRRDSGWSHLGYQPEARNFTGQTGAWLADLLFSMLGVAAWIIPLMLVYPAIRFFIRKRATLVDAIPFIMVRLVGAMIFLCSLATLAATHLSNGSADLPFSMGGVIGQALSDLMVGLFSLVGSSVVLWTLLLFALTLFLEVSWLSVLEGMGRYALKLIAKITGKDDAEYLQDTYPEQGTADDYSHDEDQRFTAQAAEPAMQAVPDEPAKPQNKPLAMPQSPVADDEDYYQEEPQPGLLSRLGGLFKRKSADDEFVPVAEQRQEPSFDLQQQAFCPATDEQDPLFAPMQDELATRQPVRPDAAVSPSAETVAPQVSDFQQQAQQQPQVQQSVQRQPEPSQPRQPQQTLQPTQQEQQMREQMRQRMQAQQQEQQVQRAPAVDFSDLDPETVPVVGMQPPVQEMPAAQPLQASPQEMADAEVKKGVKIVPLSEAHVPMKDNELGLDKTAQVKKRQPRRKIPSMDLMDPPELKQGHCYTDEQLEQMSRLLESKLKDFGIVAEVVEVNPGPVITRFELQPAPGVKASRITNLAKDLARSMAVMSVRVVEVIAGKSVIGIEIPNEERQMVRLSEVLNSKPYKEASSKLTLGLGNDIAGNPVVANLAKMPHLLVAGTTGSGKSVGVNAMLLSLLYKATPEEVRLMLVDPKMLELSIYEGIPHLLAPVITDMKEAAGGLRWCVAEMERRYRIMAKMGVRNIAGFNDKLQEARDRGEPLLDPLWNPEEQGLPADSPAPYLESFPYIVVCIDEFADMMMVVGKKVEELIARIAQKARAAGIHLILATQRPSVDVITGLIKANVPTRIGFQVSSKIDSRTILDQSGAEHLLGNGDMLYLPAGSSLPNRVHGAFVSDDEVHRVVEAWKKIGSPEYLIHDLSEMVEGGGSSGGSLGGDDEQDALYDEAVAFVTETRKASISSVQRRLEIGYNRAARMIETMEAAGLISSAGSNGAREVLAPPPPKD